jgi:PBP1b-binding outer membrane lipoprotein LpoB
MLILVAALFLSGCSGPWSSPSRPVTSPPAARTAQQQRDLARLWTDVAAIKEAAAKVSHRTLMGTPELQRTTGAFLDRLDRSSLEPKMKNRMIDFAASAVAGSCDQCFQMLEAARPIPDIAH